jgi:tRNA threonylcarbamoyl adenosine modification protein (Sua5/YciO/YrdC/YwlC family)
MIEYFSQYNIDDRISKRVVSILENGGIIAYPTDTSWGVGCSIRSEGGIEKLRKLKGGFKNHIPTLICSDISQVSDVAVLSNGNFKFIKHYIPGPYVFVLPTQYKIEKKIGMKRPEVGIRIPDSLLLKTIINNLGNPIFSITASKEMGSTGWWDNRFAEENLFEYGAEIEDIGSIDLILDHGEPVPKLLSTVFDLTTEEVKVVREGIGEFK